MKKNNISVIAIIFSIVAILISIFSFIKINSIEVQLKAYDTSLVETNDNQESVATHPFDESLVGSWTDTDWKLEIMPDSTVYFELLDNAKTKSYMSDNTPLLMIGHIENNAILISYRANCSKENYENNPDSIEKEAYNITAYVLREASDSIKIDNIGWQNTNYSFRRIE